MFAGGEERMTEKTITIRIDEDLHKKIKIHIAQQGLSLKDYIVGLMLKDLNSNK
mgnify:FL=1